MFPLHVVSQPLREFSVLALQVLDAGDQSLNAAVQLRDRCGVVLAHDSTVPNRTPLKSTGSQSQVVGQTALTVAPGGSGVQGGWGWAIPHSASNPDAAWKFISWVESFEIAKERAKPKDEAVVEAVRAAPTKCPTCGATLSVEIVRGMREITCEYCGSVIRL